MTAVADSKKRVKIKTARPGDRFDVQVSGDGKVILTPLITEPQSKVRLAKKHGYTVAVGPRPITQEMVRKLLDEFP